MGNMVKATQQVSEVIAEISSASLEQASGLQQVNQAITQIDHSTHQNSDFVTQLGQTIAQLANETHQLDIAIRVLATESQAVEHRHERNREARIVAPARLRLSSSL